MISRVDIETVLFVFDQALIFHHKSQADSKGILAGRFYGHFGSKIDIPAPHGKRFIYRSYPLTAKRHAGLELSVVKPRQSRTERRAMGKNLGIAKILGHSHIPKGHQY